MELVPVEYSLYRGELAKVKGNLLEHLKCSLKAKDIKRVEGVVKNLEIDLTLLRKLIGDDQIEEAWRRIKCATYGRNYGNGLFSVSFKTNKTIYITKLGFWGPAKADCVVSYRVSIYIKAGIAPIHAFSTIETAEGQNVFYVSLDRPIRVPPSELCDIKFQLRGAKTCFSDYYSLPTKIVQASGVIFHFSSYESAQLPQIFYRLRL